MVVVRQCCCWWVQRRGAAVECGGDNGLVFGNWFECDVGNDYFLKSRFANCSAMLVGHFDLNVMMFYLVKLW